MNCSHRKHSTALLLPDYTRLSVLIVTILVVFSRLFKSSKPQAFNPESFPPPKEYRTYHRCNYERVPIVADFLSTAQYLRYTNASFVRFGDGECKLMHMKSIQFQKAEETLAMYLLKALEYEQDNYIVGLPDVFSGLGLRDKGRQDYWYTIDYCRKFFLKHINFERQYLCATVNAVTTVANGTKCTWAPLVYKTLREVWKGKDIVLIRGNNSQIYKADVYDTARTQRIIYAPRYHSWSSYNELRRQALSEDPHSLFILACGPACKVLAYELTKAGRRALDMGHLAKDYDVLYGNRSQKYFYLD